MLSKNAPLSILQNCFFGIVRSLLSIWTKPIKTINIKYLFINEKSWSNGILVVSQFELWWFSFYFFVIIHIFITKMIKIKFIKKFHVILNTHSVQDNVYIILEDFLERVVICIVKRGPKKSMLKCFISICLIWIINKNSN